MTRLKLKQLWCWFNGHGDFMYQKFDRDVMDRIEHGTWTTCRKCKKQWETIGWEEIKYD
jgi:hypothetical protein